MAHISPLLHERLQVHPTQERGQRFEHGGRRWSGWQVEDFKIQARCGSAPIGYAVFWSKDRLIDELIDILWLQCLIRLVMCRQDGSKLLTGHGRYPLVSQPPGAPRR